MDIILRVLLTSCNKLLHCITVESFNDAPKSKEKLVTRDDSSLQKPNKQNVANISTEQRKQDIESFKADSERINRLMAKKASSIGRKIRNKPTKTSPKIPTTQKSRSVFR